MRKMENDWFGGGGIVPVLTIEKGYKLQKIKTLNSSKETEAGLTWGLCWLHAGREDLMRRLLISQRPSKLITISV